MSDEDLKKLYKETDVKVTKYNNTQLAIKYLLNGEYGALGNVYFRYFDINLASAVTLSGQLAIRWIEEYLMNHPQQKKYKWNIIYEDTDSIYMDFSYFVIKLLEKHPNLSNNKIAKVVDNFSEKIITPLIDEGYEKLAKYVGANENRMFMKREKISPKGLWTGKKKYALLTLYDENVVYPSEVLKVKGIETVRSSTPKIIRGYLENVLKFIMTDETKLTQYIKECKEEFFKTEPEEIAFSVGVNTLSKYEKVMNDIDGQSILSYKKGCPIGVRAAITYNSYIIKNDMYNEFPEIKEGEKIKFLYMKTPNPFNNENVLGFLKNIPDKKDVMKYIDYKTQFEKTFMSPIENITKRIRMVLRDANELDINEFF